MIGLVWPGPKPHSANRNRSSYRGLKLDLTKLNSWWKSLKVGCSLLLLQQARNQVINLRPFGVICMGEILYTYLKRCLKNRWFLGCQPDHKCSSQTGTNPSSGLWNIFSPGLGHLHSISGPNWNAARTAWSISSFSKFKNYPSKGTGDYS